MFPAQVRGGIITTRHLRESPKIRISLLLETEKGKLALIMLDIMTANVCGGGTPTCRNSNVPSGVKLNSRKKAMPLSLQVLSFGMNKA